ncbi:MAG: hypothetical protein FD187_163 [bacterium]|nr:MAG: hypothetical protein FD142_1380 [bacterium]KAF0150731.1 MAG: hypothetical protein FD187_163 [bacterium]KAF0169584.1 MAG: hypothetical protein FD158_417 [bacterium]TXT22512.1 MAG: hypothetical protein FD132_467 [bacterium]
MRMSLRPWLLCSLIILAVPAHALDLWGSVKGLLGGDKAEEAKPPAEAATAPVPAQDVRALDPAPAVVDLDAATFLDKRIWPRADLAGMKKVVVGGFRVALATKATVSDSVRASYLPGGIHKSGVNSRIDITLEGMDLRRMQALVDRAYQDFLARLKANGVDLLPYETFAAHPSFVEIEAAKQEGGKPYTVEHEGRTYVVLSPTGMKLWFDQAEPLGDQGAFGWGNGRRAGDFGFDHKALVLNPLLVVDFAETASARNKGLFGVRDETDLEARAGMSLRANVSLLAVRGRAAPISSAVMGGLANLKENVVFAGRYGQLSLGEVDSNRGLVAGLALVGLAAGPVRTNQKGVMRVDPTRYEDYAGNLLLTGNRLFARATGDIYR